MLTLLLLILILGAIFFPTIYFVGWIILGLMYKKCKDKATSRSQKTIALQTSLLLNNFRISLLNYLKKYSGLAVIFAWFEDKTLNAHIADKGSNIYQGAESYHNDTVGRIETVDQNIEADLRSASTTLDQSADSGTISLDFYTHMKEDLINIKEYKNSLKDEAITHLRDMNEDVNVVCTTVDPIQLAEARNRVDTSLQNLNTVYEELEQTSGIAEQLKDAITEACDEHFVSSLSIILGVCTSIEGTNLIMPFLFYRKILKFAYYIFNRYNITVYYPFLSKIVQFINNNFRKLKILGIIFLFILILVILYLFFL